VNAGEFMRKVKKLAYRTGRQYRFVASYGKGSHGRLYLDTAFTTVKDRKKEIGAGLLRTMCRDLGIDPRDLEGR
jgi:predicted RNA binding protein YcfA (HicA-like mRNA interferase family)